MPITAKSSAIPTRDHIEPRHAWNLTDIYADDAAWEADYQRAQSLLADAVRYVGKLRDSSEILYECLSARSELAMLIEKLYHYAHLSKDLDNRVSKYQAMNERAVMLASQGGTAFAFVEPELLAINEDELLEMEGSFPKQEVYDFYIKELIRSKAHIRSHEVEELLAMSAVVARGSETIFSMLNDADLTYPSIIDEAGNEVKLTKQRVFRFLESSDRRVRRDAYEAFSTSYEAHVNTIAAALASSVNKDLFYTRARRFGSCLESALDGDNIPTSVYHFLLDTTEANIIAMHDYVALRKRILKLDQILSYDMSCPLFPERDFDIPYEDAVRQVMEAVTPLGNTYTRDLKHAFDSRWVDVYETEGKASGAYSSGSFSSHPYVLMNYNEKIDSMFTLAHEMGHAMHSHLARQIQPYPKYQYSIFVAEVASTLNEGLLMRYLLDRTTDQMVRLYLLNRHIDNTMRTFFLQVMFARFELTIHEHVEQGNALSPDMMNDLWDKLTRQYYGPSLTSDPHTPYKWARIPHFYSMYYVYQYATSYAASQAILTKFLSGEKGIIDKYLTLLSAGGSNHPIELLKLCGVDMTKPDAVLATISLFREQVAEMDRLTQNQL